MVIILTKEFDARVMHKRDTAANWEKQNPVLLKNELIFVDIDGETRTKIGDGVKTYKQLDFNDKAFREVVETKATIYFDANKPAGLTPNDLWAKLI